MAVCGIVSSRVLVPLLLRLVLDIAEFGFFHIVWSTSSDATLAYVAVHRVFEMDWRPVPSSCHPPFSRII